MIAKIICFIGLFAIFIIVDIKPEVCTPLAIFCAAAMVVSAIEDKKHE